MKVKMLETENETPKIEHKQLKRGKKYLEKEFDQNMNSFDSRITKEQMKYNIFLEISIQAMKQIFYDIGLF